MALFQNRPQVSDSINYITNSLNKTVLLVGLGNIGHEYNGTRHNIGFDCIDDFVNSQDNMADWIVKKDLKAHLSNGNFGQTRVITIKPTTFMNHSGEAVQATMHFYKIPLENVIIIYDELDIQFGQIRSRIGGSSAGHNGIKSITNAVGEETGRIRIGIGPKEPSQIDSSDFVLGRFSKDQQAEMTSLKREINALLTEYLFGNQLPTDTRSFLL